MGNEHSADTRPTTPNPETKSKSFFRRSSTLPTKMKGPKLKNLSDFQYAASFLSLRVQNFTGLRHDPQYEEIEKQIVDVSMELQKYRTTLVRDAERVAADGVQKSISDCLAALLRKAQENEADGAVESNSFVAQQELVERRTESSFQSQQSLQEQPKKKEHRKSNKNRQSVAPKYQKRLQTLQQIEKVVLELKANITNAIFCQQTDSFEKYESKIKTICRDLELVDVDEHSPLAEKKKELYDLLIKCNNNIKKTRRRMERQVAVDVPDYILARSEMTSLEEEIHRTEQLLQNEHETFEGLKLKFEQLLVKVDRVKNTSELQERKKVASEVIRSNLSKIFFLEIQKRLSCLKAQIDEFFDVKHSNNFVKLDQQLRQLWDEVSTIEGSEERKFKVITEIQNAIQTLLRKAEGNEKEEVSVLQNKEQVIERSEPAKQKKLEEIIDSFILEWHSLKLHAEANKWSTVEKARIKIKLANVVSNIQDILDTIEKQDEVVVNDEVPLRKEVAENVDANKQAYSKPVVHVKPETSKSVKEEVAKKTEVEQPSPENARKQIEYHPGSGFKDTGERLNDNTTYFNFTAKRDESALRLSELRTVVEDLKRKVTNFNEAVRNVEYEKVKNAIEHCVSELRSLQPKGKFLLQQVYELAEQLEIKVAENQSKTITTRTKLKELVEKLQSTKKKIDNFTGTYKNVLYTKIEDDLKQLITAFDALNCYGDKKLLYATSQTKQKAQQYLKILESKSAKTDDVQETLIQKRASTIAFEDIHNVRVKLMEIKDTAENFSGFSDEPAYKLLQKELTLCARKINDIEDTGRSSIRESKLQYLNYIAEMRKYLEQKAQKRNSEEYVVKPIVTDRSDPQKELEQIEESFAETARKIEEFKGNPDDKLYGYLDEMIIATLIELDNLDARNEDMVHRKNYLKTKVHQFGKLMGEKVKSRQLEGEEASLDSIRRICASIKFEIDCRSEIDEQAYSELNERLVNLLLKVDAIKNEDATAKTSCKEYISEVLRILQGKINYQIKFISDLDAVQI